jgi:hypothetical protein
LSIYIGITLYRVQFLDSYVSDAYARMTNKKTTKEVNLDIQDEDFASSFSDPNGSIKVSALEARSDFQHLKMKLFEHHQALREIYEVYLEHRSGDMDIQTWLIRHGEGILSKKGVDTSFLLNRQPIIESVHSYRTLWRGFHKFRTYDDQAQRKYNCGIIATYDENEGGCVEYFGEILEMLHIDINGVKNGFCKVRWFDHDHIYEHEQLPGVPIARKPVQYIKSWNEEQYEPYIPIHYIKGCFCVGDIQFPEPCAHDACKRKLAYTGSAKKRTYVPCKNRVPTKTLFPLRRWKPGRNLPDMTYVADIRRHSQGLALIRFSGAQGCLPRDNCTIDYDYAD